MAETLGIWWILELLDTGTGRFAAVNCTGTGNNALCVAVGVFANQRYQRFSLAIASD